VRIVLRADAERAAMTAKSKALAKAKRALRKFALLGYVSLIFQPIPQPAVNDLPLIANRTEIEKVRPFFL
jgi:hypothetical protein